MYSCRRISRIGQLGVRAFRLAPVFVLVNTETLAVEPIGHRDHEHQHGACSPLKALGGQQIDAVIVGGIGPGAIQGLQQAGIGVFQFLGGTVAAAVQQFQANALPVLTLENACGGRGSGQSCGHHAR